MKYLLGLLLLASPALADNNAKNAATAFATGFANAVNVQLGGVPYTPPTQTQQVVEVQPVRQHTEIRAIRSDGTDGPVFMNYDGCWSFVHRTFGFETCSATISYF